MSTDRIERSIVLRAPPARVWRALTDAQEFGQWFCVRLQSGFVVGERAVGQITNPGYEHVRFEAIVECMEPERLFALRWHPNALEPARNYHDEPTTLIEFRLEPVPQGTRLTVTESGFDALPASRREEAYRGNDAGWAEQLRNIEAYLAR